MPPSFIERRNAAYVHQMGIDTFSVTYYLHERYVTPRPSGFDESEARWSEQKPSQC